MKPSDRQHRFAAGRRPNIGQLLEYILPETSARRGVPSLQFEEGGSMGLHELGTFSNPAAPFGSQDDQYIDKR